MSSRQNSSISTSSIMVKQLEKRNLAGKKMTLPNDLKSFKRQIELLFGLKQPVQALYTENGELITDVNQIFPSTTIIASTSQLNSSSFSNHRQNTRDSLHTSYDKGNNYNNNSNINDNDLSYDSEEDLLPPSSNQQNDSFNNTNGEQYNNSSSFTKQSSKQQGNADSSQIRKRFVSSRQIKQENENSDYSSLRQQQQNRNENQDNSSYRQQQQSRNENSDYSSLRQQKQQQSRNAKNSQSNNYDNDDDNFVQNSQNQNENLIIEEEEEADDFNEDNKEEDLLQSDDETKNENPPEVDEQKKIVSKLVGPQYNGSNIEQLLGDSFSNLDAKTQNSYKSALKEEDKEQRYAFQNLIKYLTQYQLLIERENLTLCDDIIKRCQEIINRHRTVTNGCIAYNMKSIIVGPRNSGKSTLLAFLLEKFLTELSVTQTWKRNFVFIFDAKKLASSFVSYIEFYNTFIDMIFESVKIQRPGFLPYMESICNYFKSIPQNLEKPPAIPKRFETNESFKGTARSLEQIGIELFKCIQDSTAFMAWHTNVLLMPSLVASAFGFSQIHYVIDNAEYLDAEFTPSHPFVGSSDPIDIVEYFKYAISNSSFILSCENMDEFLSVFGPQEDSVDLIRDADFVDVFGFENDQVYGKDIAFMVKFEEDPRTFKFTVDDCGGCPAFLSLWEEMCRESENKDNDWSIEVSKYNEHQFSVKSYLEYILKYAFVVEDSADETQKIVQMPIIEIKPINNVA